MRQDSAEFGARNQASTKYLRYVISHEFEIASVYCTSHTGISGVPGVVIENVLQEVSAVSQRIVPDEGRSEIGSLNYQIVDVDSAFTSEAQDKLADGQSFRGKIVRLYVGHEGMAFSAFQLFTTQVVKDIEFDKGVYSITCSDISRELREEIFEPKKTNLRDNVDADDTTIPVYSTAGFELVGHGPSYSDGPNDSYIYFKLDNEKIRASGKTPDTFTGCTRGALNTKAVAHTVDAGSDADRRPKVEEVIYLELPGPKLVRAIQTGEISPNYIGNGGFETDSNTDGTSDGWQHFVGGSGDAGRTHSLTRVNNLTVGSTKSQRLEITGGVGNSEDSGIFQTSAARVPCGDDTLLVEGQTYILSAYVRTNAAGKVDIRTRQQQASGTIIADQVSSLHPGGSATVRLAVSGTVLANAVTLQVQVRGINLASEFMEIDDVQLEVSGQANSYAEGPIANQSNELPTHWHCGVDPHLIRTSDFVGVGPDLWNTRLDTDGFVPRFEGLTRTTAKRFIESELYMLMGCYPPIYSDGTIGFRRMNPILADAAFVLELNESNIVSTGPLRHDYSGMHNRLSIEWNWNGSEFTRNTEFLDLASIGIHGESEQKALKFKGLHGSRHTEALIRNRLSAFRDRYSAPPETIQVRALPSVDRLEVGDTVRLKLASVRDLAGTESSISRSFEIQRKSHKHNDLDLTFDLLGSTQAASIVPPNEAPTALPDAFYTATGTELSTVVDIDVVGDVGVIQPGTYNLTGHATDINRAEAVYYYDGDLELANGATITINDNVQIRAKGFFTINGIIDGVGRGKAGVADSAGWNVQVPGTPGFIGNSRGMDGIIAKPQNFIVGFSFFRTQSAASTQGQYSSFPFLELRVDGNSLLGIPPDLRGTSGGAGGKLGHTNDFVTGTVTSLGGTGADSGAGLCIVSRGLAFGASATVNLSGDDAAATSTVANPFGIGGSNSAYPGPGGAGSPGGFLILLDGSTQLLPDIGGKFIGATGTVPISGGTMPLRDALLQTLIMEHGWTAPYSGYRDEGLVTDLDLSNVAFRIQYIPGEETPQEDQDTKPPKPAVLFVLAAVESVRLQIGGVNLEDVDLVQFVSSATNDRTVATVAAEGKFLDTVYPIFEDQVRYYWSRTGRRGPNGSVVYSDWEPLDENDGATNAPLRGNFFCPDAEFARATDSTYWYLLNGDVISPTGGTYGGHLTWDFSVPAVIGGSDGSKNLTPRADLLPITAGQSVSVRLRVRRTSTIVASVVKRLYFDVFSFDQPSQAGSTLSSTEANVTLVQDMNTLPLNTWTDIVVTTPTAAFGYPFARIRLLAEVVHSGAESGTLDIDYFQAQLDAPVFAATTAGLVPKPTATTTGKQKLRDDGSWISDALPPNSQSGNYTCVAADANGNITHPSGAGSGDTFTIPSNASVSYELGTTLTFFNLDGNTLSIAITSDTMTLAGTTVTGTRTLSQNGVATAIKLTSTGWLINGTGLT